MKIKLNYIFNNSFYFCFYSFVIIYSFFSSPTPNDLAIAEIVCLILLFLMILQNKIILFNRTVNYLHLFFLILLCFFLTVPTLTAIYNNVNISDFFRDIAAVIFFFLFVFFYPYAKLSPDRLCKTTSFLTAFMGLIFSLKYLKLDNIKITNFSYFQVGNLEYFSADPSVFFAAIYFACESVRYLHLNNKKFIFYFIFSFLCFLPLLLTGFRLQIFLFLLSFLFINLIYFFYRPCKTIVILFLSFLLYIIFFSTFNHSFFLLLTKHINLGLNGRDLELFALNEVKNVSQFLFGFGWGSLFNTPLIQGSVRFVHNFFLYFYIKTGFVGFLSILSVVIFTFIILIKVILKKILIFRRLVNNNDLSISLASFSSLIYAFFFSGAFKSLSIGLILIIVSCLNLKKIN